MTNIILCPICGGNVSAIDTPITEYHNYKYYDTVEGMCRDCGKLWQWVEVFAFDHYEEMEEINPNDHL